ncbi:MAG: metallophosphoesterase, partial [Chitinophagaceae bacterium]
MRKLFLFALLLFLFTGARAQFKYAFVSDTHIGATTGEADLRKTVADINLLNDIDFTIITGDITEMGTLVEIRLAKEIFSGLKKPYYIIPGNHDTGWSESGGVDFIKEFGYDKFSFDHKGYRFMGCASGPYVRMSDGHIPRDAVVWMDSLLKRTPVTMPLIFVNHYPIDNSLDNWYEVLDRLKTKNIQYIINGHGHNNQKLNYEGIEATMGRSNLRAKDTIGGYNIVTMTGDSVFFSVKRPGMEIGKAWRKVGLKTFEQNASAQFPRPVYTVNETYPQVHKAWEYHSSANVVLTPAANKSTVVFGNSLGLIEALSMKTGKKLWEFKTNGAIYSSPAISGKIVAFGSGDGHIYALSIADGSLLWKFETKASVLGAALVAKGVLYIGGGDGCFRALDLKTGSELWKFDGVEGAIAGTPLLYMGKVIFGSWGRHLYSVDQKTGKLDWKWNNGSQNRMFSPAMCTPVANNGIVFVAAPDKVLTAIDVATG